MKKYFIHTSRIAFMVLLANLMFSCTDDFFDTRSDDKTEPSTSYKTIKDAELLRSGCYTYLQEFAQNKVIIEGLLSDEMNVTSNADADMSALNLHEASASNAYVNISSLYDMISYINEIMPNLAQIIEKDKDFDSATYRAYIGSFLTIRAWGYLNLARLNGKVIRIEGYNGSVDVSKPVVYTSKNELIDQLINELVPYYDNEDIFRYPVDHYVMLGELYLEKNDYANAIIYLKYACDGESYGKTDYMVDKTFDNEDWFTQFISSAELIANHKAVFSAVDYDYRYGQGNSFDDWFINNYQIKPSSITVNAFKSESNGDEFRGNGISYVSTSETETYIFKYALDASTLYSSDVILYRDADVHLMLAEALNRTGQSDFALILLNSGIKNANPKPTGYPNWTNNLGVRGRVKLSAKTVPAEEPNKIEYVENLLLEERAKELAFEGKRWSDLMRIATRRSDPTFLANKVAAKFSNANTANNIRTLLSNPENWYIPILTTSSK